MATYVCAIAGGKGGVGRTTTAINLGTTFQEQGYNTVVVDGDLGMSNVARMLGFDPDQTLHDVLVGDATVEEVLHRTESGLDIVPGAWELTAYAKADPGNLSDVVDTLRENYALIIIDTSAGISHETTVPLGLSDGVVLVTTVDEVSLYDTIKTVDLVNRVGGSIEGTLLTQVTDDPMISDIQQELDLPVLGAIPEDDAAGDEPLVQSEDSGPGEEAYRELTRTLLPVFFENADPEQVEPVFDEEWTDRDEPEETDPPAVDDDDDDTDDDDVVGLFN